ncbi:MAG: hypothetical protein U0271_07565 [Polyangiaceae bacterium]
MPIAAQLLDVALFWSMERYGDLSIHAVLDVRRRFTRAELERAFEKTIADFPVLGCRYEIGVLRDRWVEASDSISNAVHVREDVVDGDAVEATTLEWVRKPIVATVERPFRVVSLARASGSRLLLSVLHIAVDGAGVAAVGHVFGSHLYGVAPLAPADRRRDVRSTLDRLGLVHLPVLARDVARASMIPLKTLLTTRRRKAYDVSPTAHCEHRDLVITKAELDALRARFSPVPSINDLLVAGLSRAVAQRSHWGPATVLYTMDLRRFAAAPRLTAANVSTILTAHVPREATGDLETAVRAVQSITSTHRSSLIGPGFLVVPHLLGLLSPPPLLRRLLPYLHPLLVDGPLDRGLFVTNVGRVDDGLRAFDADLESLRILGPLIAGTAVPGIVAFGFRGSLHLQIISPPHLGAGAAAELEREVRAALELPAPSA